MSVYDLTDEKQFEEYGEAVEGVPAKNVIVFDKGDNYIGLVYHKVTTGNKHYITMPDQSRRECLCLDENVKRGFDPDNCPLCAIAKKHYDRKKEFKLQGKEAEAKHENDKGNEVNTAQQSFMLARKGRSEVERKNGKKIRYVDFEIEVSEDQYEPAPIQFLRLSQSQASLLRKIAGSVEHIQSGADLMKYVINFEKEEKVKGGDWAKVVPKATKHKNIIPKEISKEMIVELENIFSVEDRKKLFKEYKQIAKDYWTEYVKVGMKEEKDDEDQYEEEEIEDEEEEIEDELQEEEEKPKSKAKLKVDKKESVEKSKVKSKSKAKSVQKQEIKESEEEITDEDILEEMEDDDVE